VTAREFEAKDASKAELVTPAYPLAGSQQRGEAMRSEKDGRNGGV